MLPLLSVLLVSVTAAPAPCVTATPACTDWVALGGGPSRSMVYRTHPLDRRNEAITRVFVLIHGAGRNADDYFHSATAAGFLAGALDNTLIIAPRMASNDGAVCRDALGQDEISWHCSTWRSGGPSLTNAAVTSFDFLDELLRRTVRKDVFPNVRSIVVAGHSAGGQVVNRYSMSSRVHDALGVPVHYIVSNPSSYAWPSDERPTPAAWSLVANPPGYIPETESDTPPFRSLGDGRGCTSYDQWPYGMQNRAGYSASQSDEQLKRQLASRRVTLLLGDLDILPLGGFDGSCSAMAQGPTRCKCGWRLCRMTLRRWPRPDGAALVGATGVPVVVIPLCNPNAYRHNWRYPNAPERDWRKGGYSVGDSVHLLPDLETGSKPRAAAAAGPDTKALTQFVLRLAATYPPRLVLDLHEDELSTEGGYIYSQGTGSDGARVGAEVIRLLEAAGIPIRHSGRTRFGEPIVDGVISRDDRGQPIRDGSIDELLAATTVFVDGRPVPGPAAGTVIVVETPAFAGSKFDLRVGAHGAVVRRVSDLWHFGPSAAAAQPSP